METELVIRAQRGDEAAFTDLMARVSGRLIKLAYGVLRDPGMAEDATQQALVTIWKKLPTLREPSHFNGWSYRLLIHACYAEAGQRKRALPELPSIGEPTSPDDTLRVVDRDQLDRAFMRLSLDHRAVIVLHHYLDLSLPDTADALGVSVGTVKSRLNRSMKKLRLAMHADMAPVPGRDEVKA